MPLTETPGRQYGGLSAADRAAQRRRRLLEAALGIMAEDGWRQITVERLCGEARLNKRYFYESFTDLDAVAATVVEELADQLIREAVRPFVEQRDLPIDELVRRGLSRLIRYLISDPRRARVLWGGLANTPAINRYRAVAMSALTRSVVQFGLDRPESGQPDPIFEITAAMLLGGTGETVLQWLDGTIDVSEQQLVEELSAHWLRAGETHAARLRAQRAD